MKRLIRLLILILILFTFISLVFSIKYYAAQSIFNSNIIKVYDIGDFNYYLDLGIENNLPGKREFDVEIIYDSDNLVVSSQRFSCKNYCERNFEISKVFFGDYTVSVVSKYENKYYRQKLHFSIKQPQVETYNILFKPSYKIQNGRLNIEGDVISNSLSYINYYFEIFPKSAPSSISYFNLSCKDNCSFYFTRDFEILIDEYIARIYSPIGEIQKSFQVKFDFPINSTNNSSNSSNIELEKIVANPSEYFLYDNSKRLNTTNVTFKKNNVEININEILINDTYDIEFNFKNNKIEKIIVNNVSLTNLSIGYEEIDEKTIDESRINFEKIISSAFAINPKSSDLTTTYDLTYIATGDSLYKCVNYNFTTQNCFGNFVKVIDTIPGQTYTLTFDMIDPLFVELIEPTFKVQRGLATGTTSTITNNINPVNMNKSLILFTQSVSDPTPDDNQFTAYFQDNSTVAFNRYDGAGILANIEYQVIESNQFTVQRGESTLGVGASSVDISLNSVNLNETFVVVKGRCADEATGDNFAGFFYGNLTNSTNLHLVRGQASLCAATVSYQVVEFKGANVQSGFSQFDSTLTSLSATINSINPANTFLVFGTASIGSDPGMDTNTIRGTIFSDTQITFNRYSAVGTSNRDIVWYAIEHPDINVQTKYVTFSNGGLTETLTSVVSNMSKSFHLESYTNTGGGQTWSNTLYSSNLTTNSTIFFDKTTNSQTIHLDYFVVEFTGILTHTTVGQVNLNATTIYNMTLDDLSCNYELDTGVSSIFINWFKDSISITSLALPFEGNLTNSLLDYSSNSNNIISNSGATWSATTGYDGNSSYNFTNNQMIINHNSNLNINNKNTTFSLWFYSRINSGIQTILSKNNSYSIRTNENQVEFELYSDKNYTTSSVNFSPNSWNHLAIVVDYQNNLTIYFNSNKILTNSSLAISYSTDNLIIGNDKNNNYFNGYLDEIQIFNIELSSEQILNIYENKNNKISNTITEDKQIWQCKIDTFNLLKFGFNYPSNTILINDNSPKIENMLLNSTGPYNYFYDNLSCNYDIAATATSSTFNWYVDFKPLSLLNLPFDGNSSNALKDYSGNNYIFTNNNAIWQNISGYNSTSAFSFNGVNSFLKYDIPDLTLQNFTLSLWVKSTSTNQAQYTSIFSTTDVSSDINSFQIDFDGTGNYRYLHNKFTLNIGPATTSWQHIAITSNGTSHTTYLNGVAKATSTVSTDTIFYLYKLGVNRNSNLFYNGLIDNVQLFNKTLSSNQINNLYLGNHKMDSANTQIGQMWQCSAIPFSLYKSGKTINSNILGINDNVSVPIITNVNLISAANLNSTQEDLTCDFDYTAGPFTTFVSWFNSSNPLYTLALPFDGNSSNALKDYSGNGINATLFGNTIWKFDGGNRGGAFYFDGNNDYLNFGNIADLVSPSKFSISLWFKRVVDNSGTALDTNHLINNVLIAKSSKNTNDNFELGSEGGNIELYVDTSGTDNFNYYAAIQDNVWHHVVVTYDSSDVNELKLYVDSNFITQWNTPSGSLARSTAPLSLGIARPDGDYWGDFNGFIDDLIIVPFAFSQDDVTNLYNYGYNKLFSKYTSIGDSWSCTVNAFSSQGISIPVSSSSMLILKLKRIYLQLEKKIDMISSSFFNIFLSLSNLADTPTSDFRNISILTYLPKEFNLSSSFVSSSYSLYTTNFLNQSINNLNYKGILYKFDLVPTTNYVFDSYLGSFNSSNQFNLTFNISGSNQFNISQIIFGIDTNTKINN